MDIEVQSPVLKSVVTTKYYSRAVVSAHFI